MKRIIATIVLVILLAAACKAPYFNESKVYKRSPQDTVKAKFR